MKAWSISSTPPGFKGETREERVEEFCALHPRTWVAGLREGTGLRIEDDAVQFLGTAKRIERVLWNDPATGVTRHADAGCEKAIEIAKARRLELSMMQRPARSGEFPCIRSG